MRVDGTKSRSLFPLILTTLFVSLTSATAQDSKPKPSPPQVNAFNPEKLPFSEERLRELKVPPGFKVNVFARDLGNARMLATGDDGTIYVTCHKDGKVIALRDKQNKGIADDQQTIVSDLKEVHGIAIHEGYLYLTTVRKIYRAKILGGGKVEKPEPLNAPDLPVGGFHSKRTIAFGPDDMLYISIGSTCNDCEEKDPESAAILRAKPDGTERKVFANGLRNTIGFAWHPVTHELFGGDNGPDGRGDEIPPEEINRIVEGGFYGWPFCYGTNIVDARSPQPKNSTKEEMCAKATAPALTYTAHSAPIGFTFYTNSAFPKEFQNDAFIIWRGSWNRLPPSGYKVARVRFKDNKPVAFEDFLTGFLTENGKAQFARIAGITVAKDGALLVSDDQYGIIYRVSYANAPNNQASPK
jgi:glucose/arabinose dehydrogenase